MIKNFLLLEKAAVTKRKDIKVRQANTAFKIGYFAYSG